MLNPSLDHCIWIEDKRIVFIFIPKVACTSWKLLLWQLLGNQLTEEITYKTVHNGQDLALPYVGKMEKKKQEEFVQEVKNNRLNICGMIREPKARVLSGYLDKVLNHCNPNSSFSRIVIPSIREQQGIEDDRRPTFLEFLKWNLHNDSIRKEQMNDHWRQMHKILGINKLVDLDGDKIKIWDLKEANQATEWFNIEFDKKVKFPSSQHLGPRPTNNSENKIKNYYGDEETKIFELLYNLDVELHWKVVHK